MKPTASLLKDLAFTSQIASSVQGKNITITDHPSRGTQGVLDSKDTFVVGKGRKASAVGKEMFEDVAFRARIVQAAHDLAEAGPGFGNFGKLKKNVPKDEECWRERVNETLWTLDAKGEMAVRATPKNSQPFSPAAALRDIFKNGDAYAFDCVAAQIVIQHKAILDTVGDAVFDKMFSRPTLRFFRWEYKDPDYVDLERAQKTSRLIIGNVYHYHNAGAEGVNDAFAGENVMYLGVNNGKPRFYAHGILSAKGDNIVTEKEILRSLRSARAKGSKVEPYRDKYSYYLDSRALMAKMRRALKS